MTEWQALAAGFAVNSTVNTANTISNVSTAVGGQYAPLITFALIVLALYLLKDKVNGWFAIVIIALIGTWLISGGMMK